MSDERLLVCTDLDRTLLPNGPQPESPGARALFARLAGRDEVQLAYVSGRDPGRVRAAIAEYELPLPDFVISDVGTTILTATGAGEWEADTQWAASIGADWGARDGDALHELLRGFDELRRQEDDRQAAYKLSYYAPVSRGELPAQLDERLAASGVQARVVWSVDEARNLGLIDVLPASASKYHAIRALATREGLSLDSTVFCGDSGNDMEVLVSEVPAVLVANGAPEVMAEARQRSAERRLAHRLYIAMGGFMGMNGCYAAGMLEGIAHFHPLTRDWLTADSPTAIRPPGSRS